MTGLTFREATGPMAFGTRVEAHTGRLGFLSFFLVFVVLLLAAPSLRAQQRGPQSTLTLAEALEIAEKRSETVGIAQAGLSRAEGERQQARSSYFPQLSGSASYQRIIESQFANFDVESDSAAAPAPVCNRFVPQPGLPIDQRLDSLEHAVKCASAADP